MKKILSLVIGFMLTIACPVLALEEKEIALATDMSAEIFTASNGIKLPYRMYVPQDYSKEKPYSLLLFLHGAGNRGDDNLNQISVNTGLIERIVGGEIVEYEGTMVDTSKEFIIIAPQCQKEYQWVDTPWDKSPDPSYDIESVPESMYMVALYELLENILEEYNIDEERQYVTGLSMGGFGTWDLLMRQPDRWAAAIPMGGGADLSKAELIRHIPIWTFHQFLDTVVLSEGTQNIVAKLVEVGGNIKFTTYFDLQHNAWTKGYAEKDLLQWLYSNKKGSVPQSDAYPIEGASDWAKKELGIAYAVGIMPDTIIGNLKRDITREEFCESVIAMIPDSFEGTRTAAFKDTESPAVNRAYALGIVNGRSEDTFAPSDFITLEEICAVLHRAFLIISPEAAYASEILIPDESDISDWAKDDVKFMTCTGVVSGDENGFINPKENTTYEQAIVFVYKAYICSNSFGKIE